MREAGMLLMGIGIGVIIMTMLNLVVVFDPDMTNQQPD